MAISSGKEQAREAAWNASYKKAGQDLTDACADAASEIWGVSLRNLNEAAVAALRRLEPGTPVYDELNKQVGKANELLRVR